MISVYFIGNIKHVFFKSQYKIFLYNIMNKLYLLLLIVIFILIIKYYMNIEAFNETEKNAVISRIDTLSTKMTTDYKVFNNETTNMAIQQQNLLIILSITTFILVGVTIFYVINK
jgi:hypothetical protein